MSDYFRQYSSCTTFKAETSWAILSALEQKIKDKIEKVGTPLKDWDITINRGILTGYNEAFIINAEERNKLISRSPDSVEIIRPILRGRDIKKYNVRFSEQWIINTHNGIKSKNIEPINAEKDYPGIFEHLKKHEKPLKARLDKGIHWSNLRNCAYLPDLEKEKLVWLELTDHPNFAYDQKGFFINNTIFFMTGNQLKYLLAYLNSKLCEWYFDKIAATSGVGTRRWIKIYIDQICVPKPSISVEKSVNELVDIALKNPSNEILNEINFFFYRLFNLETDEIEVIEKAIL